MGCAPETERLNGDWSSIMTATVARANLVRLPSRHIGCRYWQSNNRLHPTLDSHKLHTKAARYSLQSTQSLFLLLNFCTPFRSNSLPRPLPVPESEACNRMHRGNRQSCPQQRLFISPSRRQFMTRVEEFITAATDRSVNCTCTTQQLCTLEQISRIEIHYSIPAAFLATGSNHET